MTRRLSYLVITLAFVGTKLFAQVPANNECATAYTVTVSKVGICTNPTSGTILNATQSMAPCFGTEAKDVWYKFTATNAKQTIQLTRESVPVNDIRNPIIELFSGTCAGLTSIECINEPFVGNDITKVYTNLTVGETYYIRVYSSTPSTSGNLFRVCIWEDFYADECGGALTIPVSAGPTSITFISSDTRFTTSSMASCFAAFPPRDIWMQFTATNSNMVLVFQRTGLVFPAIEVMSGTCGALTNIACLRNFTLYNDSEFRHLLTGLNVGETYYLRVYSNSSNSSNDGTFNMGIYNAESNDDCSGADLLTVSTDTTWQFSRFSNKNRTSSTDACHLAGWYEADSWFKFVADDTVHLVALRGTLMSINNTRLNIYSGSCGSLTAKFNCAADPFSTYLRIPGLVIGQTYYVNVMQNFAVGSNSPDSFRIALSHIPANDDPGGAITLTVNPTEESQQITTGNTHNSSPYPGLSALGCGNTGVWYKFVATDARHIVALKSMGQGSTLAVYTFNGSIYQVFNCPAPSYSTYWRFVNLTGLSVGTTYFVRVGSDPGFSDFTTSVTHEISVTTPASPASNDECADAKSILANQYMIGTSDLIVNSPVVLGCALPEAARTVWYAFTAPFSGTGIVQLFTNNTSADDRMSLQILTGNCAALTSLNCVVTGVTGQASQAISFTSGETIYIKVMARKSTGPVIAYSLNVTQLIGLPVTLTSIYAVPSGRNVKVFWKTELESHINYYQVERSSDGKNFVAIGKVTSRNSSNATEYNFEDISPANGINYYRLKIVDADEKTEYSRIAKINLKAGVAENLLVSRQGNEIIIINNSNQQKSSFISIQNTNGQVLQRGGKILSPGANKLTMPISAVNQVLFIRIGLDNGERKTFKIFN